MPAKSAAQRRAAGMALSMKRGKRPKAQAKGAAQQMAKSMTEAQLEDYASKPKKPSKSRKPKGGK